MLLIALFALTFNHWKATFDHFIIKFADVMNKMVNDKKITQRVFTMHKSIKKIKNHLMRNHQGVLVNCLNGPCV